MNVSEILTPEGESLPSKAPTNESGKPAETVASVPLGESTPATAEAAQIAQTAETVSSVPLGDTAGATADSIPTTETVYLPPPPDDGRPHPKGCRCAKCPPWQGKQGRHPNGCKCGRCKQSSGAQPGATGERADFSDLNAKPPENAVDYKAQAEALFDLSTGVLASTIGAEWLPRAAEPNRPGEREVVCVHLAKYLETKQMVDLPPGAMVVLMMTLYSIPRLREENTRNVLKKAWTGICNFYFWFKGKFS